MRPRVIPLLLLRDGGVYKGVRFRHHAYVGDPINTVKLFNDKQADELCVLDISATLESRPPDFELLEVMAGEAFMPLSYGGGLDRIEYVDRILALGFEKVVVNTAAATKPSFLSEIASRHGSQSVVVSMDIRRRVWDRYEVFVRSGTKRVDGLTPVDFARRSEALGAGEILVNAMDRDGALTGYDTRLIRMVAGSVGVPVVAAGGARNIDDFKAAREAGASAVAAGAMFVFHGPHRAVLISYPDVDEIEWSCSECMGAEGAFDP